MTSVQQLQLSQEIGGLATAIVDAMGDPNVIWSPTQSTDGQNAVNQLTTLSQQIAASAALQALHDAQGDFVTMTQATADAKAALKRIQSDAAKIDTVLSIAGKALTFATDLAGGGPVLSTILSAATSLSSTSKNA